MKRVYILGLLLICAAWTAQAEVLWWSTDAASDIDVTFAGTGETVKADSLGVTDVRIRYADSTDYLPFASEGEDGGLIVDGSTVTSIPVEDLWTDIGTGGAGRSFVVELGNWNGSEWTSKASATAAYSSLKDLHIGAPELGLPAHTPWNVTGFTAVPEPTSGLLTLLGAALLALRRKKQV